MLMRTDPVREAVAFEPDELLRVDVVQDQQAEVLSDEAVERERLRLEFEGLAARAPLPLRRPAPRIRVGCAPVLPLGLLPASAGRPASGPHGFAARSALSCPASRLSRVTPWTGSGSAGVRRHRTST